jgi:hypothetical protein
MDVDQREAFDSGFGPRGLTALEKAQARTTGD